MLVDRLYKIIFMMNYYWIFACNSGVQRITMTKLLSFLPVVFLQTWVSPLSSVRMKNKIRIVAELCLIPSITDINHIYPGTRKVLGKKLSHSTH